MTEIKESNEVEHKGVKKPINEPNPEEIEELKRTLNELKPQFEQIQSTISEINKKKELITQVQSILESMTSDFVKSINDINMKMNNKEQITEKDFDELEKSLDSNKIKSELKKLEKLKY